jgi:hypothetical protein
MMEKKFLMVAVAMVSAAPMQRALTERLAAAQNKISCIKQDAKAGKVDIKDKCCEAIVE